MREVRVVAAAILDARGWLLVAQRPAGKAQAGLWELPGGKVEPGEADRDALAREIREELGMQVDVHEYLAENAHLYPEQGLTIRLVAYRCVLQAGAPQGHVLEHQALDWLPPGTPLSTARDWAPADVPLLAAVQAVMCPQATRD